MAQNNSSKKFTIELVGDQTGLEKTLGTAERLMEAFGGKVSAGFTKINEADKKFSTQLTFTLNQLKALDEIKISAKKIFAEDQNLDIAAALKSIKLVSDNQVKIEADAIKARTKAEEEAAKAIAKLETERLRALKLAEETRTAFVRGVQAEALKRLRANSAEELAIARSGANSLKAIELQRLESVRLAEKKLQDAMQGINPALNQGAQLTKASGIRNTYAKEIQAANDLANSKVAAIKLAEDSAKASQDRELSNLNRYISQRSALLQAQFAKEAAINKAGTDSLLYAETKRKQALKLAEITKDTQVGNVKSSNLTTPDKTDAVARILATYEAQQRAIEAAYSSRVKSIRAEEALEKAHTEALRANVKMDLEAKLAADRASEAAAKASLIRSQALYKSSLNEKIALLQSSLAMEKAIAENGANSLVAIKTAEAEKLRILQKDLNSKLTSIGGSNLSDSGKDAASTAAIAAYKLRLSSLQALTKGEVAAANLQIANNNRWLESVRQVEDARLTKTKAVEDAQIANTRKRIAMQIAIEQEGVNGITALKEKAKQLEAAYEARLQRQLAQITKDADSLAISGAEAYNRRNIALAAYARHLESIRSAYAPQIQAAKDLKAAETSLNTVLAEQTRLQEAAKAKSANSFLGRVFSAAAPTVAMPNIGLKLTDPAEYTRQLTAYTDQVHRLNLANQAAEHSHMSWVSRIAGSIGIYQTLQFALSKVTEAARNIPESGIRLESSLAGSTAIIGNLAGAERQMLRLREEAERTGIPIQALMKSFNQFSPSALVAGESMNTVLNIFKNVNTAAVTLHMSQDDVNGVFLALSQMFSKGKIQAEEVVKQLSQRIPAAVTLMATAYAKAGENIQTATVRLQKDMKAGIATPQGLVDKFGETLATRFGGAGFDFASQGMQATLGRLSTSWELLSESVYKSTSSMLISTARWATNSVTGFTKFIEEGHNLDSTLVTLKSTVVALAASGGILYLVSSVQKLLALQTVQTMGLWAASIQTTTNGLKNLGSLIGANAIGIGLVALLAAASAVYVKWQQIQETAKQIADSVNEIQKRNNAEAASAVSKDASVSFKISQLEEVKRAEQAYQQALQQTLDINNRIASIQSIRVSFSSNSLEEETIARLKTEASTALEQENILAAELLKVRAKARADLAAADKTEAARNMEVKTEEQLTLSKRQFDIQSEALDSSVKEAQRASQERIAQYKAESEAYQNALGFKNVTASPEDTYKNTALMQENTSKLQIQLSNEKIRLEKELIGIQAQGAEAANKQISEQVTNKDKLWEAIKRAESGGRSGQVSYTGALGISQVQPSTAKSEGMAIPQEILDMEKMLKARHKATGTKIVDAASKALGGSYADANQEALFAVSKKYFFKLIDAFPGNLAAAIAAYNAGEGAVKKAIASGGSNFLKNLTGQTRGYVPTVLGYYNDKDKTAGDLLKHTNAAMDSEAKIREASLETGNIRAKLALEQEKSRKAYADKLAEDAQNAKAQVMELQELISGLSGGKQSSAISKIELDYQKRKAALQANEKSGTSENTEALKLLETYKALQIKSAQLIDLETAKSFAAEKYQQRETDIQRLKDIGYITEEQAINSMTKAREEYTAEAEKYLTILEKTAAIENNPQLKLKAERERASLEAMNSPNAGASRAYLNSGQSGVDSYGFQKRENDFAQGAEQEKARIRKNTTDPIEANKAIEKAETNRQDASLKNHLNYYTSIANMAEDTFGSITSAMIKMYGAESIQARRAFGLQKAMSVAKIAMSTAEAVMTHLASPPPMSFILAGMAAAMGAAQIAIAASQPMPQAHGGLDYVPEDATYKLSKGERVLAPNQNKDLMNKVNQAANGGGGQPVKILNVGYGDDYRNYLTSSDAEQIIVNHMTRNREAVA